MRKFKILSFLIASTIFGTIFVGLIFKAKAAEPWDVHNQHQGVPAYFYPDWWNADNDWYRMCDTMNPTVVGSFAIMNPDSGPGTSQNPDYTNVIGYCQSRSQNIIGYVYTSYGARPLTQVKADINKYYQWYNVDGIFLDEMSNDPATLSYYRNLYVYIHNKGGASRSLVVGNPGAAAETGWQLDRPVVDVVNIFEGSPSEYLSWTPPAWVFNYLTSDFSNLIYDAADISTMQAVSAHSKTVNAGYIYITPDTLPNPWDLLPPEPYWSAELTAAMQ